MGGVVAFDDLLEFLGEVVNGHLLDRHLDSLAVKVKVDDDALALAASPGAVNHGGHSLALDLEGYDSEFLLDGLDNVVGDEGNGRAGVHDADRLGSRRGDGDALDGDAFDGNGVRGYVCSLGVGHGLQGESSEVGEELGRVDAAEEDSARFGVQVVLQDMLGNRLAQII